MPAVMSAQNNTSIQMQMRTHSNTDAMSSPTPDYQKPSGDMIHKLIALYFALIAVYFANTVVKFNMCEA